MPERSKKRPRDVNELARQIVDEATGEAEQIPEPTKDPAAVELGRRGGLKGGKARAKKLSGRRRSEIAKKAATNAFSKKVENLAAAVNLHFLHYNFARVHESLANPYPRTPATAAGVADHAWTLQEIAGLLDQKREGRPPVRESPFELALIYLGKGVAHGARLFWHDFRSH